MSDWDTGNPGDSDIVSTYPANERAQRTAVRAIVGTDHEQTDGDPNQGYHTAIHIVAQANPTAFSDGGILFTQELEGVMELFYMDEDGNIIRFTDQGQSFVGRVRVITPDTVTTHTAKESDNGNIIVFDTASDCVLTMPQQSTTALTEGYHVLVKNVGGGNVRVATEGTDTLDDISLLQEPDRAVTVLLEDDTGPNAWSMIGNQWIPLFVNDDSLGTPPSPAPDVGNVYIVKNGTGAWSGHDNEFAIHVGGGAYEFIDKPLAADSSGWAYRKAVSGIVEMFYIDNAGNRIRLTRNGSPANADAVRLEESASAPSSSSGVGNVYTKDVDGATQLFYQDSAGNEYPLSGDEAVSESSFTGSNQSLVSNGHQGLPGGFIAQWGEGTVGADIFNQAITFPRAFPNACLQFVVVGTVTDVEQTGNVGLGSTVPTTTTAYVSNVDNRTHTFRWIAVGH